MRKSEKYMINMEKRDLKVEKDNNSREVTKMYLTDFSEVEAGAISNFILILEVVEAATSSNRSRSMRNCSTNLTYLN